MAETVTILKQDLDDLCRVMAGLCAPVSLNRSMLGAAYQPWSDLHGRRAFGYPMAKDYADAMIKAGTDATKEQIRNTVQDVCAPLAKEVFEA